MIIAVDFDGTCVTAKFPELGENIGAQYVLRELVKQGHQLILYTMRGHTCKTWDGQESNENFIISALKWFIENEIPLWELMRILNRLKISGLIHPSLFIMF